MFVQNSYVNVTSPIPVLYKNGGNGCEPMTEINKQTFGICMYTV